MAMRKLFITALAVASTAVAGQAQSAIDAYNLSQQQMRGTARFMSMGGAFTALGGDLSTLGQNPGGIGVYRHSEIGITLDAEPMKATSQTQGYKEDASRTAFSVNNFGYIGSVNTGSELMSRFNWGINYSRVANFKQRFRGAIPQLNGSLSNYIAGYTTAEGYQSQDLNSFQSGYDPYWDSSAPWMSILAYNSYMINSPRPFDADGDNSDYVGLWRQGTTGYGTFDVDRNGYVDEYNIDFGGNFSDVVYWGLGFGITDLNFTESTYYTEDLENAQIPNAQATGVEKGNGGFGLDSYKSITGSGFNFKLGLIVKPINELRIGLAVHTPTYYDITQKGWAAVDYGYSSGYDNGYEETNQGYMSVVDWKLKTPWRLMAGIAGVIGNKAIISADYEYRGVQDMNAKPRRGPSYNMINDDIDTYYQGANILRLGAEYRLDKSWSLRAGYSYETSPVKSDVRDNEYMIYTSGADDFGTTPSYTLDKSTQYVSCGIGYKYKNIYLDAAYVYRHRSTDFHPYTPNDYTQTPPTSEISDNAHNIVVSFGVRW